jgi:hypothetical protein
MSESIAKMFHDEYERLAPIFGYKTRKESCVPWEDVPENNRNLMIAVCEHVVSELRAELEVLKAERIIVANNIAGSPATIVEWSKKVGETLSRMDNVLQENKKLRAELARAKRAEMICEQCPFLKRLFCIIACDEFNEIING